MKRALPRLVLVTDWSQGEQAQLAAADAALRGHSGVAVQHRWPGASTRAVYDAGLRLAEVCARHGAPLFASARLDLALSLGAHLHLPAWALPPAEVRAALPGDRWVSCAVHDGTETKRAAGADFALVSPVWAAGSKPADPRAPLGPAGFRALEAQLPCPAFALGGVTPEHLAELGPVPGAAAVSWVWKSPAPHRAVAALLAALGAFAKVRPA